MPNGLPNEITDVPEDSVGTQVQQLVYTGVVTRIECEKQANGRWTIRSN